MIIIGNKTYKVELEINTIIDFGRLALDLPNHATYFVKDSNIKFKTIEVGKRKFIIIN